MFKKLARKMKENRMEKKLEENLVFDLVIKDGEILRKSYTEESAKKCLALFLKQDEDEKTRFLFLADYETYKPENAEIKMAIIEDKGIIKIEGYSYDVFAAFLIVFKELYEIETLLDAIKFIVEEGEK